MKTKLSAVLFLMSIGMSWAQPETDSVEVEIEGNRITLMGESLESLSTMDLNRVIREVVEKTTKIQRQQQELLARVQEQQRKGEITADEAEEMQEAINERTEESMEVISELMETWGEAYSDRWEAWADEYEARMEAWEAEVEQREDEEGQMGAMPPLPPLPPLPETVPAPEVYPETYKRKQRIIISDEGIVIEEGDVEDEPFALKFKDKDKDGNDETDVKEIDRTETYFDIHFGFNQLLEDGQFIVYDEAGEQDFWKSTQFELGLGGKTRLGNPYSKLYLKWGGEISWHNFRLNGDNILVKGADRVAFVEDTNSYSVSKFEATYLNIPLMLVLDWSELGKMDDAFTLGLGGYAGFRIHSERELEYNDFDGEQVEEERENDFYTNPLRYGVMAQVGWKNFKITAKYDFNPFFQDGKGPLNDAGQLANLQMASVSLGFTF